MATKKTTDTKKAAPAAKTTTAAKGGGDIDQQFEAAAKAAKQLKEKPDNDTLLKLYAFYKQGSEGDVSGDKPGFFDFVATAKYEAWSKLKGTKADDAKKKYIDLVKRLSG